jgi:hypothetical protein
MTPLVAMAKTASALVDARKEIETLRAKLATHEKRAAAEEFLVTMMQDARSPLALKPSSVTDFLEKRAAIEQQDLEVAKLAAKMAASQGFEIGNPEPVTDAQRGSYYNESRADAEFQDWLLGSQG